MGSVNRLIIIGNGFDLQSGLHSTFQDFFENYEKPKIEKWLKNRTTDNLKETNIISLLLYNTFYRENKVYQDGWDLRWHDIHFNELYKKEFGINNILLNWMDVEEWLYLSLTSKGFEKLVKIFKETFSFQFDNEIQGICEGDEIPYYINSCFTGKNYFDLTDVYDFFLKELESFECDFIKYLEDDLKTVSEYLGNAEKILEKLTQDASGTILNFNYTFISHFSFTPNNVHGSLDDEIIIGIDGKKLSDKKLIPFTKTFRKLIRPGFQTVLDNRFDEVVIYGHSLGEQDYSYFQSIFDYLNIYNGKAKIKLIYSDNFIKGDGPKENRLKEEHKVKIAKNLFRLIDEYGQTLDNKDNGKNLLHKLILEGRLKMESMNFIEQKPEKDQEKENCSE